MSLIACLGRASAGFLCRFFWSVSSDSGPPKYRRPVGPISTFHLRSSATRIACCARVRSALSARVGLRADFEVDLRQVELRQVELRQVDLRQKDLRQADLQQVDSRQVDSRQ